MFRLSKRSWDRLDGVNPRLVGVVATAIQNTAVDFMVVEGVRTLERQRELVASGASQTLNSRHLTGDAVDLAAWVDGEPRWDWPLYYRIADAMKESADDLGVRIVWGGDWESFRDGPHFELPR